MKTLDDKLFDCEEALEEAAPETQEEPETEVPNDVKQPDTNQTETNQTQPVPAETLPPIAEVHEVEGMPEPMVQPKIATH